jgi:hypothetical protein
MDAHFAPYRLARCIGDWGVNILIGQFLASHRKYMRKQERLLASALANFGTAQDAEAAFRLEREADRAAGDDEEEDQDEGIVYDVDDLLRDEEEMNEPENNDDDGGSEGEGDESGNEGYDY